MITESPFRIATVAHLAALPDDPRLHRLIATYETQSDYGVAGRDYEPTGTTEVLVATFDHAPSAEEIEAALAPVRERPDDAILRLRYRFLRAEALSGDALSRGEQRRVTEILRDQDVRRPIDLPEAGRGDQTVIYPPRWAPNSYAAALVEAAARVAPSDRDART